MHTYTDIQDMCYKYVLQISSSLYQFFYFTIFHASVPRHDTPIGPLSVDPQRAPGALHRTDPDTHRQIRGALRFEVVAAVVPDVVR